MSEPRDDPVLRSSRRETAVVLLTWLAALLYTVTYCYLHGYDRPIETLTFVLGFPDWVFWGIIAPWTVCFVLSFWFSHMFMSDGDLGEELDEANESGGEPVLTQETQDV